MDILKRSMRKDIFICWSGERSKTVAEALRDWIPNVIQFVKPWMSSKDIYTGDRWFSEVADKLQNFKFGIICLTPENINSSWVHFEAGALARIINESSLCPYLIGLNFSDITGPLAHFQSSDANEIGTLELIMSINHALGEDSLEDSQLKNTFNRWWPDLNKKLDNILESEIKTAPKRDTIDILEEILKLVRSQARTEKLDLPTITLPSFSSMKSSQTPSPIIPYYTSTVKRSKKSESNEEDKEKQE